MSSQRSWISSGRRPRLPKTPRSPLQLIWRLGRCEADPRLLHFVTLSAPLQWMHYHCHAAAPLVRRKGHEVSLHTPCSRSTWLHEPADVPDS